MANRRAPFSLGSSCRAGAAFRQGGSPTRVSRDHSPRRDLRPQATARGARMRRGNRAHDTRSSLPGRWDLRRNLPFLAVSIGTSKLAH